MGYNNVKLSGSGDKTLAASSSIGGTVDIGSTARFVVGAVSLTVTGTTTVTGTLWINAAGGLKTFTGLLTLNSGTWDNTANEAVTFRGGITNNSGTFNAGTGIQTFDTNAQALAGTNTSTLLSIPSITVTGVVLTNNITLTVGTALAGTGGLTQGPSATLNIGGTSGITNLTATASGNTVNFSGASQTVNAAVNYHHLTLSGNGTAVLQTGTTAIGGDLALSGTVSTTGVVGITIGGKVDIGVGATFTAGAFTHQVGGDWTNNTAANFVAGTGSIIFTGTGTHSINGTSNFYSLGTNGAGTINLVGATGASGILTMASGSTMNTNDNLTLLSTSDAQAGSIANLTGVTFNGNVAVQRYMSAADNYDRFISSPILNAPVSQLQATIPLGTFPVTGNFAGSSNGCAGCSNNSASLWWYKESIPGALTPAGYIPYPTTGSGSSADPLYPGVGYDSYMWNAISGMTTTFSGTINKGDVNLGVLSAPLNNSITHTNTGNASADGWNLVGNPYPSAVVWNTTGWNKTNIDQTVWIWDVVHRTWYSYLDTDGTGVIAMGQAFWVYAPSVGSASLTIHETAKAPAGTGTYYRKSNNESRVVVSITKGDVKESAFITLNEEATTHYVSKVDFPKIQLGIESMHLSFTKDDMNLGYYAVQPNFDHDISVRFVADESESTN